ncbi:hypothetical protein L1887_11149 [Cichorium endivia]|nr:hypothetical protein L1887_11149 [Cichorium endivia]
MPQKEDIGGSSVTTSNSDSEWGGGVVMDIEELMTKRFEMAMGNSETTLRKTELDKYFGEDREPMDPHFDILKWWKNMEAEDLKDLTPEQPIIIIDESVDETSEIV